MFEALFLKIAHTPKIFARLDRLYLKDGRFDTGIINLINSRKITGDMTMVATAMPTMPSHNRALSID